MIMRPRVFAREIYLDGSCNLRDAIAAANQGASVGGCRGNSGADTIWLRQDVRLWSPLPSIRSDIRIEGNGYAISGASTYQIFEVAAHGKLSVHNVALVDGRGADDGEYNRGGAILNRGETRVDYSTFRNNTAEYGGAIHNAAGSVTVSNSLFIGNSAGDRGGAIRNHSLRHLEVYNSRFERNTADWGGAIHSHGETFISHASFYQNSARTRRRKGGGGLYVSGFRDAKLNYFRGRLYMSNSDLGGNSGADCEVYAGYGELIESENNRAQDGSCWARWSGGPGSAYCPAGQSRGGRCQIGASDDIGAGAAPAAQATPATDARAISLSSSGYTVSLTGRLSDGNPVDHYELDARGTDLVEIDMIGASGNLDAYLEIVDSRGNLVGSDDDSGDGTDAKFGFVPQSPFLYTVRATRYGSTAGNYQLLIWGSPWNYQNQADDQSGKTSSTSYCPTPAQLRPGDYAHVSDGPPNRVRTAAGLGGRVIGQVQAGELASVLEGPLCVDGYNWYRIDHARLTGWTAEGGGGEYWMLPASSSRGANSGASSGTQTNRRPALAIGGHVLHFGEAAKAAMRSAGMSWVKWQIPYDGSGDLTVARHRIRVSQQAGFRALLSVTGEKHALAAGGDAYLDRYAAFLGDVARLGADAIEVWNEMNLDREWPAGQIDPRRYAVMLQKAYRAIKAANSRTMVITGAPAPTGAEGAFGLARVWNDDRYYQGMADAGVANFADCIGVHYNEGVLPPRARSGDPRRDDYPTRYLPAMLERVAQPFRNYSIPMCLTEIGYLSPEGYGRLPDAFSWAANTSAREQAQWLAEAIGVAADFRAMPVELLIVWNIDFDNYGAHDPQAGYAIIRPDGRCPACNAIAARRY